MDLSEILFKPKSLLSSVFQEKGNKTQWFYTKVKSHLLIICMLVGTFQSTLFKWGGGLVLDIKMHLLDTFMQGTFNKQEIVLIMGYSRRPQARYRLERQGISTFLL